MFTLAQLERPIITVADISRVRSNQSSGSNYSMRNLWIGQGAFLGLGTPWLFEDLLARGRSQQEVGAAAGTNARLRDEVSNRSYGADVRWNDGS